LRQGMDSPRHLTSIAAWIAYTAAAPRIADDPLADRYAVIWAEAGGDVQQVVARFVGELGMVAPVVRDSAATVAALTEAVAIWRTEGPRAALRAANRKART
jgi:fructuronate reductase